ncbi:phosphotransferase family protein [uncultured Planktomarina sp.]|jgi:aminoglycoside phosphotransferase (APT) family kinase protein|uniref:phosphotransferase family protein n=1 Tax=uncultured Planktomarina sp. TaxID=1538529 RepID=UPI003260312D
MTQTLHSYDSERLSTYLEQHVAGFSGMAEITKFSNGQSNPTYKLTDTTGSHFVLRAKPPGTLLKSAHAVDREFRVMTALATSAVPVPKMLHLSGEDSPMGAQFLVMEHLAGRVFWDPALPEQSPEFRQDAYHALVRTLAALHDVDPRAVGLADFGKPGNYFSRQVSRWTRQYRVCETQARPDMDWTIDWLDRNMVQDDGQTAIVHGDYRLDNVMFDTETPDMIAVLDWELSTLGHPFADLAYQCMGLRLPQNGMIKGLKGIDRNAHVLPEEAEYVAQYCALRGIAPPENWAFYMVFSFFRLAAILEGVLHRAQSGNASNPRGIDTMSRTIATLAQAAKHTAQGRLS